MYDSTLLTSLVHVSGALIAINNTNINTADTVSFNPNTTNTNSFNTITHIAAANSKAYTDSISTTPRTPHTTLPPSTAAAIASIIAAKMTLTSMSVNETAENTRGVTSNPFIPVAQSDIDYDPITDYVPPSQRPETYIVTILFTLIFIVGVLGNGTLVIIFFRHRSMRNIPNTYILSLALADLLVIIICVPLASIVYTQESWTFGADLCRVSEFFKDISIGVSVFTLTALSGERYCAIVNPLRKLQTKPLTVFTAVMIWILAILLATPSFVVSDIQDIKLNNSQNLTILVCTPFGRNRTNLEMYTRYTVIGKACVYYLLPLSIIGALYILIAKRLARDMPGETLGVQSRSQARARRHVAHMVVAFVVVFFACFFPYHLFELWFHLNPTAEEDFDEFWHAVRIIGFCTSFLNSCVNPVALYCVSGVFRQHFNRYLCCLFVKRTPRLRQHSTGTGVLDTSILSIRRSIAAGNRSSLHLNQSSNNNNNNNSNSNTNCYHHHHNHNYQHHSYTESGGGRRYSNSCNNRIDFQRQQSLPLQRYGAGLGLGVGGGSGAGITTGGVLNINGKASSSPTQSIIRNEKR